MPTKKLLKQRQLIKGKNGNLRLVLTEDVVHLGKQGEFVEVKPGYGRNYLLPHGLATIPTAAQPEAAGALQEARRFRRARRRSPTSRRWPSRSSACRT